MSKFFTKKIISCLTIGCLTLGLGGLAAASDGGQTAPPPGCERGREFGPPPDHSKHFTEKLDQLVNEGKISSEQAKSLLSFLQTKEAEHRAEFEKIKAMTETERQAFFQNHQPPSPPDIIADFQQAANLSEEQAKTVAEALRPPHRSLAQHAAAFLPQFVNDGTISQIQADKLLSFFQAKDAMHKAEFEKIKTMTASERQAFFQQHKPPVLSEIIADLKQAADLNEEQANKIANALRPHQPPRPCCAPASH